VKEFLVELKKKFSRENEKAIKMAELKRMKQENKTIK